MEERTHEPPEQPTPAPTNGAPTDDPAAALHWAAVAIGLAEAREQQGNPLTDDDRAAYDSYQAAAHGHGFTNVQVRDYLNNALRPASDPMSEQPTPTPPEPSHVRRVLDAIADELERPSNRRRLLTEVGLRRAFNTAVEAKLNSVPTEIGDQAADQAAEMLPDSGPVITHGAYARLLREVAGGLS